MFNICQYGQVTLAIGIILNNYILRDIPKDVPSSRIWKILLSGCVYYRESL